MTYQEAIDSGWKRGGVTLQRGYMRRTIAWEDIYNQELIPAGGRRKGQFYVLFPCFHSYRYCERHYLIPKEA